jgi:xanthine dehydrogenase large subunit
LEQIEQHNRAGLRTVRGLALTPLCFGISFTATHLNQASVCVNVYTDGSVGVAISAVEMGQGVSEKMRVVVARSLGLRRESIAVDYTNSSKTANMSPTAASVGADLCGMALLQACERLRSRLSHFAEQHFGLQAGSIRWVDDSLEGRDADQSLQCVRWQQLVREAYLERVDLVQRAFYATPDLYFDRTREQGHPFAYHVYGVSAIEATLDRVLGTHSVDRVDVVYDLGQSLDPVTDLGQMEGGLVQGIAYTTLEEIRWDEDCRLLTDSLSTYKIPDLLSSPVIDVEFIGSDSNPHGPFSAKAIGEPPFLLGLGAYAALLACIRAANPAASIQYELPLTPEKALSALYA